MRKTTTYYADPDPLFDELVEQIPQETRRHHDMLVEIGDRIVEILKRKGWSPHRPPDRFPSGRR